MFSFIYLVSNPGNRGFLATGDWIKYHAEELKALFEVKSLPSYSAIRRVMLDVDYEDYAARLAKFLDINPSEGETVSLDGKTLRGSYQVQDNNPNSVPHPAIILVSAYIAERGLILPPKQVECGSNEITALPELIKDLAVKGVVFSFDSMNTQKKTIETIVAHIPHIAFEYRHDYGRTEKNKYNGLGFVSKPLYLFSRFYQDKPVEKLIGEGIKAQEINDDRGFYPLPQSG